MGWGGGRQEQNNVPTNPVVVEPGVAKKIGTTRTLCGINNDKTMIIPFTVQKELISLDCIVVLKDI